jgi:hypothetical protein
LLALRSLTADYRSLTSNPFVILSFPGITSEEQRSVASNFARCNIPASVLDAPDPALAARRKSLLDARGYGLATCRPITATIRLARSCRR